MDQPEALAAVTVPVPSVRKQGFNFATVSKLLPCRGCSSTLTSIGPAKQSIMLTGGLHHTNTSQTERQQKQHVEWVYTPYSLQSTRNSYAGDSCQLKAV